jgi:hypothetical protein
MKKKQQEPGAVVSLTSEEVRIISEALSSFLEGYGNGLQYVRCAPVGYEDARDDARAALLCTEVLVKLHPRQEETPVRKKRKEG